MGIIVFLGDSITDAGRMTSDNPLGDGYVSEFAAYITGTDPNWRVLNKGVDGNITERIAGVLQRDCISYHPDYVSILVGINDVGLIVQADVSEQEKLYMLEDSIRAYHEMLFDLSRETTAAVITLEPFIFRNRENTMTGFPGSTKCPKISASLPEITVRISFRCRSLWNRKSRSTVTTPSPQTAST